MCLLDQVLALVAVVLVCEIEVDGADVRDADVAWREGGGEVSIFVGAYVEFDIPVERLDCEGMALFVDQADVAEVGWAEDLEVVSVACDENTALLGEDVANLIDDQRLDLLAQRVPREFRHLLYASWMSAIALLVESVRSRRKDSVQVSETRQRRGSM